nr:hypothetical protein [Lachnospiraceae bacterium]
DDRISKEEATTSEQPMTTEANDSDLEDASNANSLSDDSATEESVATDSKKSSTKGVDIDLTTMSANMVYAEVYNMVMTPDDYIGKTVKMSGECAYYHDENTNKDYYACIIKDATACCAQGIEFELAEGDYPKHEDPVTVTGVFTVYEEDGQKYCTLKNGKLS